MSFTYPFALLALIAIPVIIVIYILKNKYRDETAPSTYLWELSEKFLKKRNPLRKMEHLLSLIMQCLAICGMAFALAHPVFTVKGGADNMVFVIDGSASMSMVDSTDGKKTRFELAKEKVDEIIKDANVGSTFTIIMADNEPRVVCKSISDKSRAQIYVDSLELSSGAASLETPMNMAQEFFSNGTCNVCYLATDRVFSEEAVQKNETLQNINLIDVSDSKAINYAITELNYEYYTSGGKNYLHYSGKVINYNDQTEGLTLKLRFYVDGTTTGYITIQEEKDENGDVTKAFTPGVEYEFDIEQEDENKMFSKGAEVKAVIENEDCLAADNTMIYYNTEVMTTTNVLLVQGSDAKIYMKAALQSIKSAGTINLKVVSESAYKGTEEADIYVFDSVDNVTNLPTTGALWFVNCENVASDNVGFKVGDRRSGLDVTMKYSDNKDDALYNQFTKDCQGSEFPLSEYIRYSIDGDFTSVLSYDNVPLIFGGKNSLGQREIVFAFDLSKSNFVMSYDFLKVTSNFINYSNPTLIKTFNYSVQEKATFSVPETVKSISVLTPKNTTEPLDIDGDEYVDYQFTQVGTYTITVNYESESDPTKSFSVYVSYPNEEGDPYVTETKACNMVTNVNTIKGDGLFDNILPFVIVAAVLFAGDWILYTHEQY
jgi:Ca-activated chloride channel homolog